MAISINAYKVTLMVEAYIGGTGSLEKVAKALKYKGTKRVLELIETQSWEPKHIELLKKAKIINTERRVGPRKNINRSREITSQVAVFLKDVGSAKKLSKFLGMASPVTLYNRINNNNWTEQEKALLTSKRILDDTF